jgi:glyoxylase-like metal-dependent hydrolase (beta-lactamase superfamily II)
VWAISTPGHSKGHISYLINCEDRPVFLAGDACIINKSLELGVGPGTSSADKKLAQKTLDKIGAFIKNNPSVEVWCGHEVPVGTLENVYVSEQKDVVSTPCIQHSHHDQ